jgi:hypothetical protein
MGGFSSGPSARVSIRYGFVSELKGQVGQLACIDPVILPPSCRNALRRGSHITTSWDQFPQPISKFPVSLLVSLGLANLGALRPAGSA